jgi:hypothetical protein
MRDWVTNVGDTFYIIGTVAGPHPYPMMVRDFQSIIGREAIDQMQADWRLKIPNDKVCEFTTNNDLNNPPNCVFIPAGGTVTVTLYFKKYNDPKYTEDLSKYSLNPSDITISKVQ